MNWLEYLHLAEEADKLAAQTKDQLLRSAWRCVGESCRDLAKLKGELRAGQSPNAIPSRLGSAAPI
jgi:hypothetical protein